MIDINGRYDHYPFSEQLPINIFLYLACRTGEILFGTFQANGGKCESHAVGEAPKKLLHVTCICLTLIFVHLKNRKNYACPAAYFCFAFE